MKDSAICVNKKYPNVVYGQTRELKQLTRKNKISIYTVQVHGVKTFAILKH